MRRTERLFQIIQILRRHRHPVRGQEIAEELGTSLRTIYRDIVELRAQRVPISGEAGIGYVLEGHFDMPPLMLTPDELEAAALGASWVAQQGDEALKRGAKDLIAKIMAVTPEHLQSTILDPGLDTFTFSDKTVDIVNVGDIRTAMRTHKKIRMSYRKENSTPEDRTVWPIKIAYFEAKRLLVAWCELRCDFRHFRTDRIHKVDVLEEKIPERMAILRKKWKIQQEKERQHRNCAPS